MEPHLLLEEHASERGRIAVGLSRHADQRFVWRLREISPGIHYRGDHPVRERLGLACPGQRQHAKGTQNLQCRYAHGQGDEVPSYLRRMGTRLLSRLSEPAASLRPSVARQARKLGICGATTRLVSVHKRQNVDFIAKIVTLLKQSPAVSGTLDHATGANSCHRRSRQCVKNAPSKEAYSIFSRRTISVTNSRRCRSGWTGIPIFLGW